MKKILILMAIPLALTVSGCKSKEEIATECATQKVNEADGVALYRTCDEGRFIYFSRSMTEWDTQEPAGCIWTGKTCVTRYKTVHHQVPNAAK